MMKNKMQIKTKARIQIQKLKIQKLNQTLKQLITVKLHNLLIHSLRRKNHKIKFKIMET